MCEKNWNWLIDKQKYDMKELGINQKCKNLSLRCIVVGQSAESQHLPIGKATWILRIELDQSPNKLTGITMLYIPY